MGTYNDQLYRPPGNDYRLSAMTYLPAMLGYRLTG